MAACRGFTVAGLTAFAERGPGRGEGWVGPDGVPVLDKIRWGTEWVYDPELHCEVRVRVKRSRWARRRRWSWQNRKGRG
jgi:hypothetical protein